MVKKSTSEFLDGLNKEQKAAVLHDLGPAMVIAGPGTGKTKVITSRIAYLIERKQARPEEILALTFTEKAAVEMEERVDQLLPYGYVETHIKTFHALGYEILQEHGFEIGLPPALKVISTLQQHVLLSDTLEQMADLEFFRPGHNPAQFRAILLGYFSRLKDDGMSPDELDLALSKMASTDEVKLEAEELARYVEVTRIYHAYQERLVAGGYLDYGDQLLYVYELLHKKHHVRQGYQGQYKYILVDEFQDTNRLQAKIVGLLVGDRQNLMVVGDDDQSIYRFRGAELSNMLDFSATFPKTHYFALTENYRSTQHIVDVAYALIQHNNPDRLEVQTGLSKKLHAQRRGKKPRVLQFSNQHEELHFLSTDIQERLARDPVTTIGVLCRNNNQSNELIAYFQHLGIPVATQANKNLLHVPAVRQCIDFVRVLHDEHDSGALYRYLAGPKVAATPANLMRLGALAQRSRSSLADIIREDEQAQVERNALLSLVAYREIANENTIGEILYRFVTSDGYLDDLVKASVTSSESARTVQQLAAFFSIVKDFEAVEQHRDSYHFWQYIQDMYATDVLEEVDLLEPGEGVHVLTAHRSKGLEFDEVYLYDWTDGSFPAGRRSEPLKLPREFGLSTVDAGRVHEAEERRLAYVAMTRARERLLITVSTDHGGKRPRRPSRFLLEALGSDIAVEAVPVSMQLPAVLTRFGPKQGAQTELPAFPEQDGWLTLTPNQVADYLADPARFYVRHILHFPGPASHQMIYGISIHAALEYFYRERLAGRLPELEQMHEIFLASWRSEGFVSLRHEEERRRQGLVSLQRYFQRFIKEAEVVKAVESEFVLEIPEQKVRLRGRYDLVVENISNGGVDIRDFKTSNVANEKVAQEKVRDSIQMGIYALAWDELNVDKTTTIGLYFTESDMLATRAKIDHARTLKKIAEVSDGIRAKSYPRRGNFTNLETEDLGV